MLLKKTGDPGDLKGHLYRPETLHGGMRRRWFLYVPGRTPDSYYFLYCGVFMRALLFLNYFNDDPSSLEFCGL